jgi:hypothetical protein
VPGSTAINVAVVFGNVIVWFVLVAVEVSVSVPVPVEGPVI